MALNLISFDALRTVKWPGPLHYIKPESFLDELAAVRAADGILFPQYWQLNPLLYGLQKRIFPSAASYFIGHNKIEQTRCFQVVAPAHVPFTLIEANTPESAERVWDAMPLPFVAKIPRSSMGHGVFLIETRAQWQHYQQQTDVLYAQEYLPIERDLRIIWVGRRIVAAYWRLQSARSFHNNIAQGGTAVEGPVPVAARKLVKHLATTLGINHGGFDIAMVGRHPYVFEFNRLFGNQGIGGLDDKVNRAIVRYLREEWEKGKPDKPLVPVAV